MSEKTPESLIELIRWLLPADITTIARLSQTQLRQVESVAKYFAHRSQEKGESLAFLDRATASREILDHRLDALVEEFLEFQTAIASNDKDPLGRISEEIYRYSRQLAKIQRTVRVLQRSLERHSEGIWIGHPKPTCFEGADEFTMLLDLDYYLFQTISRALSLDYRGRGYPVDFFQEPFVPILQDHESAKTAAQKGVALHLSLDFENLMVPRVRFERFPTSSRLSALQGEAASPGETLIAAIEAPVWLTYSPRYTCLLVHEALHPLAHYLVSLIRSDPDHHHRPFSTHPEVYSAVQDLLDQFETALLPKYISNGLMAALGGPGRLSRAAVEELLVDYWTYNLTGSGYLYASLFVGLATIPLRSPAKDLPLPWTARLRALCQCRKSRSGGPTTDDIDSDVIMQVLEQRKHAPDRSSEQESTRFSQVFEDEIVRNSREFFSRLENAWGERRSPREDQPYRRIFNARALFQEYAGSQLSEGKLAGSKPASSCDSLSDVPSWLWNLYVARSGDLKEAWTKILQQTGGRTREPVCYPEGRFMNYMGILRGDRRFWDCAAQGLADDRIDAVRDRVSKSYERMQGLEYLELRFHRVRARPHEDIPVSRVVELFERADGTIRGWFSFGHFDVVTLHKDFVAKLQTLPPPATSEVPPSYYQRRIVQYLDRATGTTVPLNSAIDELSRRWPLWLSAVTVTFLIPPPTSPSRSQDPELNHEWRGKVPIPVIIEGALNAIDVIATKAREKGEEWNEPKPAFFFSLGYEHVFILWSAPAEDSVSLVQEGLAAGIRACATSWMAGTCFENSDALGLKVVMRHQLLLGRDQKPGSARKHETKGETRDKTLFLVSQVFGRYPKRDDTRNPPGFLEGFERIDRRRSIMVVNGTRFLLDRDVAQAYCESLWLNRKDGPENSYSESGFFEKVGRAPR